MSGFKDYEELSMELEIKRGTKLGHQSLHINC